ncbi:MAG: RsmB/NOP family class I SAM-dependent RNA methyltransferase [Acidilobaceae archaeon]|nr:RsmB/NOP family class I SAM-dependent RNA methyltransferase [Acidilobaceae archaeon]
MEEKLLAGVLNEILRHKVSLDVAFKRVCGGKCARSSEERERLYELSRAFVGDYVKLLCSLGKPARPKVLARKWLSGSLAVPREPHCELSVPKWLYEKLHNLMGEEALQALAAMSRRVWWIRANTLKGSIEAVRRRLEGEGVELEESKQFPYMFKILKTPKPVRALGAVKEFLAIPHDVASAAVVEALKPSPGEKIIDACAAPGIKTSLIVALTEGRLRVTAIDISARRMNVMKHLMRRLGVPDGVIEYIVADARRVRLEKHDKALVDAPCSNTGALSKDPGLRVTLRPGKVEYYSAVQKEIVENISKYTDKIVYATCSLMPEEGEEVVLFARGLGLKDRRPEIALCAGSYDRYDVRACRLFPHVHESEGFFITVLDKALAVVGHQGRLEEDHY